MPYTSVKEVLVRIRTVILECSLGALITVCAVNICEASGEFPLKRFAAFTYVVDYEPFWSPDGRQIVLISSRHGGMKVHVMDANDDSHGSHMRQLTTGEAEDDSPAWSPDAKGKAARV